MATQFSLKLALEALRETFKHRPRIRTEIRRQGEHSYAVTITEKSMTREEAIDLMNQYASHVYDMHSIRGELEDVLHDLIHMPRRFPADGSEKKAMRWLGYMQGVLRSHDVFTLEELKDHSRFKKITT